MWSLVTSSRLYTQPFPLGPLDCSLRESGQLLTSAPHLTEQENKFTLEAILGKAWAPGLASHSRMGILTSSRPRVSSFLSPSFLELQEGFQNKWRHTSFLHTTLLWPAVETQSGYSLDFSIRTEGAGTQRLTCSPVDRTGAGGTPPQVFPPSGIHSWDARHRAQQNQIATLSSTTP